MIVAVVPTIFVVVWLVENKAPVVKEVVIRPVPITSSFVVGDVVPIPTLPVEANKNKPLVLDVFKVSLMSRV